MSIACIKYIHLWKEYLICSKGWPIRATPEASKRAASRRGREIVHAVAQKRQQRILQTPEELLLELPWINTSQLEERTSRTCSHFTCLMLE